jgi:hypothetical protein
VYVRYLTELGGGREQIETYALPIGTEGGYFLEKDLVQVLAKSVDTVLTLLPSSSGALGSLVHADGTAMEAAFTSPLSAITAQFAGDDFVATTKASASVDGYAFLIDGTSSTFTRILGPLRGLSVLASPSGKSLLYSYINRGAVSVALFDVETRASIPLPISTLTEKCVWTTDEQAVYCSVPRALSGVLPDTWYQGAFSFSDKLWKVDLVERVAILMIDPLIVGEVNIDGVALALDEGANVLVFTDKRSGALYLYDL